MTANVSSWSRGMKIATAVAFLIFALALIGLRGEAASAGSAPTARASGAASVDIDHFAFHPPTLKVAAGTKVTFTNSSKVTHTATSGSFDTGHIAPGESASVRFSQKGTFVYHCTIHPFMHGKIVVK
jgi:plastocyanin